MRPLDHGLQEDYLLGFSGLPRLRNTKRHDTDSPQMLLMRARNHYRRLLVHLDKPNQRHSKVVSHGLPTLPQQECPAVQTDVQHSAATGPRYKSLHRPQILGQTVMMTQDMRVVEMGEAEMGEAEPHSPHR